MKKFASQTYWENLFANKAKLNLFMEMFNKTIAFSILSPERKKTYELLIYFHPAEKKLLRDARIERKT